MNTFFCTDSIISPEFDIIKTAFDFTGVELREIKGRFFMPVGASHGQVRDKPQACFCKSH